MQGAAMLCMGLALAACSSSENEQVIIEPAPQPVETRSLSQEDFVNTGNDFAFNLLRQVATTNQGQSFVFSPLSVTYALGMMNEGATGGTHQQIMKVLGFEGVPSDTINALCHHIMQQAPLLDTSVDMSLANGIFIRDLYKLQERYQQCLQQFYDAEVHTLDFEATASLDFINDWCSQKTKGMIPHVLDKLEGVCYLINAIYFKADWTYAFDPDVTFYDWFTAADNKVVEVPFMMGEFNVNYTQTADCKVIRMPFGNEAYGMYVFLPAKDKTPSDILATLSTEKLAALDEIMDSTDVVVKMPRFGTYSSTDLKGILQAMGMTLPFDERLAQFGGMIEGLGNGDLYVSRIFQDAAIEVQEKGAKATAVTVVGYGVTAILPDEEHDGKIHFTANHPFVYLITEKSTGAIYFAGVFAGDKNTLATAEGTDE